MATPSTWTLNVKASDFGYGPTMKVTEKCDLRDRSTAGKQVLVCDRTK